MEPSREMIPREVMYITLQDLFWVVSIVWILFQAWDRFQGKKK